MNSWECLGGAKVKIGHDGVESRRGKALNRDKANPVIAIYGVLFARAPAEKMLRRR